MQTADAISDLPTVPAVYAMYGGRQRGLYVAYVGIAESLKQRINQHLVRHDSSVTTRTSAVSLDPDLVTEVHWWTHSNFSDRSALEAAELVAFDVLEPRLRSRGNITSEVKQLYSDPQFKAKMQPLFEGECSGLLMIPSLQDALERISELERRLAAIEAKLGE